MDGKALTQLAAEDLSERSGGKIRYIGGTSAGYLFDALLSDFSEVRSILTVLTPADGVDKIKEFWDPLSKFYVENTEGPLITLTPLAGATSVFGRIEIDALASNDDVDEINGIDRAEIGFDIFSTAGAARTAYLLAVLNGHFAGDVISSQANKIKVEYEADGSTVRKVYLDVDDATRGALGYLGITLEPIPSTAVALQQNDKLREALLPAHSRGLHAALFGPVMRENPTEFLNFLGLDIRTDAGAPQPASPEFQQLQNAVVEFIDSIWAVAPEAEVSSLLSIFRQTHARTDEQISKLALYFQSLLAKVQPHVDAAPEELKRDVNAAILDVAQAMASGFQGVPTDILRRLAVTSGGRGLYLLDQWRQETLHPSVPFESLIEGIGVVSRSRTDLGSALYVTLGASSLYAEIRAIIEAAASLVTGPTHALLSTLSEYFNLFDDSYADRTVHFLEKALDKALDAAGNPFRDMVFGAFAYAEGRTAVHAFDSSLDVGNLLQLQVGIDQSSLIGNDNRNVALHFGSGSIYGMGGADTLLAILPEQVRQGEPLDKHQRELFRAQQEAAAEGREYNGEEYDPTTPLADRDYTPTLDGGEGNDWVITIGGEKAITAGGLGRDWIFNTSKEGELWGDYASGVDANGEKAEDISANADNFWYFPDTTIMDAQHYDVLKFFGIPLTGGDAAASAVAFALGARSGSMQVVAGVLGAANLAAAATGNAYYFDHLLPFITYKRDGNDLLVGNVFDGFFRAVTGQDGIFDVPDGSGGQVNVKGVQRIRNFDFENSMWGYQQARKTLDSLDGSKPAGTMNMLFKDANPILGVLQLFAALPPIAGSGVWGIVLQALVSMDALLVTMSAMVRAAKAADWAEGGDPLVLDLDGDGIETVAMDLGSVYFDGDADRFAERTGWLKGDDGFLVLDANGNGRIDDGTEMFGGRFEGGLAELAAHDLNGDGVIDAQDAVWGDLQVWRDLDQDGVSDAGELSSLEALGIVSLSLAGTALGTTTPQGTQLLSRADITFADGRKEIAADNDNETAFPKVA